MRVAVTGGAGYIGSVVVEPLQDHGHSVLVVDNLSKGHRDAVPSNAQFAHVDLAETARAIASTVAPRRHVDPAVLAASRTASAASWRGRRASARGHRPIVLAMDGGDRAGSSSPLCAYSFGVSVRGHVERLNSPREAPRNSAAVSLHIFNETFQRS
jgi:hypothetical protein